MTACGDELHLGTAGEWRALEARIAELEARLEKRTQLEFEAVGGRNTPRITVTKAGTDVVLEWETAGANSSRPRVLPSVRSRRRAERIPGRSG